MAHLPMLLSRLKQRKLYRPLVVYAVGGIAVIEGVDALASALQLSSTVVTAVAVAVIALFPVAVLLDWRFGILSDLRPSAEIRVAARKAADAASVDRRSIAVLPFDDMSPKGDQEYFGAGIAEQLINALSHVDGLKVASRTSTFVMHARKADIREIGQSLGVATVLEGSVRMSGDRLRITAQLIEVATCYQLFSEIYEQSAQDVFAIQDEITAAIVSALQLKLASPNGVLTGRQGTADEEAYHLFIKGRHFWYQRNIPKALECFELASTRDPGYAPPHAGIADAHAVLAHYGFEPSTIAYQRAQHAAERAVVLDPRYAEGHASLALTETYFGWDFRSAERKFRRALELNPALALAHGWLGILYGWSGRSAEAIAEAHAAERLEPLSPLISCTSCIAHFYCDQFEETVAVCRRGLEISPEYGPLLWCIGLPLTALERHEEAIAATERSFKLMNGAPWVAALLGERYARAGRRQAAFRILNQLEQRDYVPHLATAWIRLWLGEDESALEEMRKAFAAREAMAWFWGRWPGLERLGTEPEWRSLFIESGVVSLGGPPLLVPQPI